MPITFSVTCDTDEELARFLEKLRFGDELLSKMQPVAGKKAQMAAMGAANEGPVQVKPTQKGKAMKAAAPKTQRATASKPGRKPSRLIPVIDEAIKDMTKKGKPFRSRDVIDLVMKRAPELNESSVTTGVSKRLNETSLDWEQIKDSVGRPYKLYKP